MLGLQGKTGGALQLAIGQQRSDPPMQSARHRLASDQRQVDQLAGVALQVVALLQALDQRLIGQLLAAAGAVDQHDAGKTLPHLRVLQNRQKRRQPGATGQQPEVAAVDKAIEGEKTEGQALHQQLIAHLQAAQLAGELATRHHDGEEFEKLVMGRRHHRIGTPDDRAAGLAHAQAGELAGAKTKTGVARAAQAEQRRRPWLHAQQLLAGELLGGDSHTAPLSFVTAVSRKAPRRNTAGSYAYIHYAFRPARPAPPA